MEPPIKIDVDHQRLASILGIISDVSIGRSSPVFIEERVRELQEYIPFLPQVISWMADEMDRLAEAKEKDIAHDPVALGESLAHRDMLCWAQGALAALLCVGESLRSQAIESASQKIRKGTGNARKRRSR